MTPAELDYIIQEGETHIVEFKESVTSNLAREMVAFANAAGGRIFIGIADDGTICGTDISNAARSRIQDLANNCQPRVPLRLEVCDTILIAHIQEGHDKPYQCSDGFYLRMGANSQKMNRDELIDFLQSEGRIRFEDQIHSQFDYDRHFDSAKLDAYLALAGINKNLDDRHILENLGVALLQDGRVRMKNVGVLLFAKSIALLCEQATITCVQFDGKKRVGVLNRKDFQDDLISNINNALYFVKQCMRVRYEMTGAIQRKEIYEFPLDAIREAIVNAVSHRDYFQFGAHTTIEFFDDRIEIGNPGGLPKGLSTKEFGKKSVRRNPMISSCLQRVHFMENIGTGIQKIKDLLKDAGCHKPQYEFGNFVTIIFKRVSTEAWQSLNKKQPEHELVSARVDSQSKALSARVDSKSNTQTDTTRKRTMRESILAFLNEKPMTKSQLSLALGQKAISGQLNLVLRQLCQNGMVIRQSSGSKTDPTQRYAVLSKTSKMEGNV